MSHIAYDSHFKALDSASSAVINAAIAYGYDAKDFMEWAGVVVAGFESYLSDCAKPSPPPLLTIIGNAATAIGIQLGSDWISKLTAEKFLGKEALDKINKLTSGKNNVLGQFFDEYLAKGIAEILCGFDIKFITEVLKYGELKKLGSPT